ncbi:hypothetical protein IM511_12315 [Erythrobacteraceae bacterium E2-1 Yellow Sea]|nr:hypothetical protein [Erythrobacteraceae bacterium E2-1 Yellow Sea]
METTIDTRTFLADAIRRALSGQDVPNPQVEQHYAGWRDLSLTQRSALVQLQNWSKDGPLRAEFAPHAEYSQHRLTHLLDELEALN